MSSIGIPVEMAGYDTLKEQMDPAFFTPITEKETMIQLNGVILPIQMKEQLPQVIDWLLFCQEHPRVFVWVYSTTPLDYEQELLLQLGANEVVINNPPRLTLIVKNSLIRLTASREMRKTQIKGLFLNKSNQSMYVNGQEELLTRKEFLLIQCLYEKKETCVTYDELVQLLWPNNPNKDLFMLANTIFRLRQKLNKSKSYEIKTIRSKGYLLHLSEETS